MENNFKKYLAGLGVFVLLFTLSCSTRETTSSTPDASTQQAQNSYDQAQSLLGSLALTFPSMSDFATTNDSTSSGVEAVFSGQGDIKNFDTTKFNNLDSAIISLQAALTSYASAPKSSLSLSPGLVSSSWKNSDLVYLHFLLGYYYTLHAVLRLRSFVADGIIMIEGNRYKLSWDATTLAQLQDKARQAVLDAYFLLSGHRKQISNSAGTGLLYGDKKLHAGLTQCASHHFDECIRLAANVFPALETILDKLQKVSFKAFFDEIEARINALGITDDATD